MAEITISNQSSVESAIRRAMERKMKKVFLAGKFLLTSQAKVLRDTFANSEEFTALKGKLKGEFGFTNEEVTNLDRILDLLVPGGEITTTKISTGPGQFLMTLEWVDFAKLKVHDFALHELTRLDETGQVIDITDIISWVEWLEEGATVRGYQFFRPSAGGAVGGADPSAISRSGEGLMKKSEGDFWTFRPTRVFERIAKSESADFLKKGFGILVKRRAK
jgi:hypothetical protein